jgi:hypothetical protein
VDDAELKAILRKIEVLLLGPLDAYARSDLRDVADFIRAQDAEICDLSDLVADLQLGLDDDDE